MTQKTRRKPLPGGCGLRWPVVDGWGGCTVNASWRMDGARRLRSMTSNVRLPRGCEMARHPMRRFARVLKSCSRFPTSMRPSFARRRSCTSSRLRPFSNGAYPSCARSRWREDGRRFWNWSPSSSARGCCFRWPISGGGGRLTGRLRQLVASGEFGAVRAVMSHNIENWQQTIGGTWRDDPEANPGGFIGDAGSHKIDAVFFVTGLKPREIFARCDRCGSRVEITGSISALLDGAVPLTMDFVGHAQHFSEILTVHCARGDLTLREGEIWIGRDGRAERYPLVQPDCNPVVAFLDSLWQGAGNFAPPECALPVFDFTQAIFASARSGAAGHAVGRLRRREVHGRPAVRTMLFVALFSREKSTKISSAPVSGRSPSRRAGQRRHKTGWGLRT